MRQDQASKSYGTREWHRIVDLFCKRIDEQYLLPVKAIKHLPGSDLAILALDCLLIELLQQFREGRTTSYFNTLNRCYLSFFTETSLNRYFSKSAAAKFYRWIRNPVIHKGKVGKAKEILAGRYMRIACFHDNLEKVFEEYAQNLKTGVNEELKENFLAKMIDMGWLEETAGAA